MAKASPVLEFFQGLWNVITIAFFAAVKLAVRAAKAAAVFAIKAAGTIAVSFLHMIMLVRSLRDIKCFKREVKQLGTRTLVTDGAVITVTVLALIMIVQIGFSIAKSRAGVPPLEYNVGITKIAKESVREIMELQGIVEGDPQIKLYPSVPGKFDRNGVREGAAVKKGDALVFINRDIVGYDYLPAPVRSPIDGIVTRLYFVDRGAAISPDRAVAEVANSANVKVVVSVGESDIAVIRKDQVSRIVSLQNTNISVDGTVDSVTPFVDKDTLAGTVIVRAVNTNRNNVFPLTIGMSVKAEIDTGAHDAYMVPERAVLLGQDRVYVYIMTNGKAKALTVLKGYARGEMTEIIGELSDGMEIVTDGAFKLYDGAAIKAMKK
ncbi:MAG: efflux RND transporter periplasmic adaptor subunit [Spirochaetota bacterium]